MNTKITLEKRILSVLLTFVMVFSMMPTSVFAENTGNAAYVTVGGVTAGFDTYELAVAYANEHEGSTLKLLTDVTAEQELEKYGPVTGNFTLDLNGKSIDWVCVGKLIFDDPNQEPIGCTPGKLTVIGNGNIEQLSVSGGGLTVNGGTIGDIDVDLYAGTVNITGGVVERLEITSDEEISAVVSGGSVQALSMNSLNNTVTFTGGNHASAGNWHLDNGTVKIDGGSFGTLRFFITGGNAVLNGGKFDCISTYIAGSSEYKNPPLGKLLGTDCAFFDANGNIVDADTYTLKNVTVISGHEHKYVNGKCSECGAMCSHAGSVDLGSGVCFTCKVQFEAAVEYKDGTMNYFESFVSALDSVPSNMGETVTVLLLKDFLNIENNLYLNRNNNIRLDLNDKLISGFGSIIVQNKSSLILTGGALDFSFTVEAAGGALTVDETCGIIGKINVTSADSEVSVKGGSVWKLSFNFTDTASLKNVNLSGGTYQTIEFSGGSKVIITDLLEPGYAFCDNEGILTGTAGDLVRYGIVAEAATNFAKFSVVPCNHTDADDAMGMCRYCGKLYEAKAVDKDGSVRYIEKLQNTDFANGDIIVLLRDMSDYQCIPEGSCIIDLNGYCLGFLSFLIDGTVTLKGSGTVKMMTLGYGEKKGTLIIDEAQGQTITVNNLYVNNTENTKLTGGTFKHIEISAKGLTVGDLLADGYSFFDDDLAEPFYTGNTTSIKGNYNIKPHSHHFSVNIEGETQCLCGLICNHEIIGENGKCSLCEQQIYVAVLIKADGTKTNYESFTDAWTAAVENIGSTLKLLSDTDLGGDSEILVLESGKFTFDLGGFAVTASTSERLLEVGGTAEIVIKNGELKNTYSASGDGQAFKSSANAIIQKGGTVTLDGVKLTGGNGTGGEAGGYVQSYAIIMYNGSLTVTDCELNGAIAVFKISNGDMPVLGIKSTVLHNGISYACMGAEKDFDAVKNFFAEGGMLFDGNGKYIDITEDGYWTVNENEYFTAIIFSCEEESSVKQHEHSFADGVCSDCDYHCPHDSGKNDREASYFEKAVCSVCHGEYGDTLPDITMPTGEIRIKERTWWQSLLNTVSFGLFYNETVTAEITGTDDSGIDVVIGYLISDTALTEEEVKKSDFMDYTGPIDLSDEGQYVIYVRVTDWAGNISYASTDGFEIDKTAPVIEGMVNGKHYEFCVETYVTVIEKNIDKVTLNGYETFLDNSGRLRIRGNSKEQTLVVTDKAGNTTTVYIKVHPEHSFDEETLACSRCGINAVAKLTADGFTKYFASASSAISNGTGYKRNNVVVTMLRDVTYRDIGTFESYITLNGRTSITLDLNGHTLYSAKFSINVNYTGTVKVVSTGSAGKFLASVELESPNSTLIIGDGVSNINSVTHSSGTLEIYSGRCAQLFIRTLGNYKTKLYGGSFNYINIVSGGLTCADLLAPEYRYKGIVYEDAKVNELKNVEVVSCAHDTLDESGCCTDCGYDLVAVVEKDGVSKNFESLEEAIRYAEENDGSTVKLCKNIVLDGAAAGSLFENGYICFARGTYTLDLAGKTLTMNDTELYGMAVMNGCNLTIKDSVGGGKIKGATGGEAIEARADGRLIVMGGDFTELGVLVAYSRDSLTLYGGSFNKIRSYTNNTSDSPFDYLADGYAFMLGTGKYANDGDVNIGTGTDCWINGVTVVEAPLAITADGKPVDLNFYLTSSDDDKYTRIRISCIGEGIGKTVIIILEKADGTEAERRQLSATDIIFAEFSLKNFTVSECGHPGYEDDTHKCVQCDCTLEAVIVNGGKITGYTSVADAVQAAQTEANKGCTLRLLTDLTDKLRIRSGAFTLDATGYTVGVVNVANGAELTIIGGTVNGNTICAKGGKLIAYSTTFKGTVNCTGEGDFTDTIFENSVTGRSVFVLKSCNVKADLNANGTVTLTGGTVTGTITVNMDGSLKIENGNFGAVIAKSGGELNIYGGSFKSVGANSGSTLTIYGGFFSEITVGGKKLIECLGEGFAFKDTNNEEIIDGRVSIAGNVEVVKHTHSCVWKTSTHEKLCGCGFVEQTDTKAPVFGGIEDGGEYYGDKEFTVTDDNEFTLTVDGKSVTLKNGKYTLIPDNARHTLVATDIAGNSTTVTIMTYKVYNVTKPTGVGYLLVGMPTAMHNQTYLFSLIIDEGYSMVPGIFKVLVNGSVIEQGSNGFYCINNVSGDLVIEVEGVADITPPEAEITIDTNKFRSFMNAVTFGLFFKKTQTVIITASDAGSGVKTVEYLLSETVFADKGAIVGEWTELILKDGKAEFSIEPNKKAYVYIRITDQSGNITVINSEGVVVYTDSEKITESIDFTIFDKNDVSFNVKLNGNTVKALYNGTELIDSGNYTVSADGTITLKNAYLKTLAVGEYIINTAYNPLGESYVSGDEPAMTSVRLTVKKAEAQISFFPNTFSKTYDGNQLRTPGFTTSSRGTVKVEYKPLGADDSEYSTVAPKNAGKYVIRISVAETDTYNAASIEHDYEILKKSVTIDGVTVSSKIYDGTTVARITSAGTLSDNYDGENLTIVMGTAAYDDKNVGTDKTVTFSGFALAGDAASNYELSAQPTSITAVIFAKELTIDGLKVKDKQYDGNTTAEIDGKPALVGVVAGDVLELVNGIPTFGSSAIGKDIPIEFTAFALSGDSVTVGNYKLVQPMGITANIVEYIADGSEYDVNSNDWINTDFVITAKNGYKLSLTGTADGEWTDILTASDETSNGKLTFYVKNTATGVISSAVTENYKIDKTAPVGEVKLNGRLAFRTILNTIGFDLFFGNDVNVKLTATDEASGVKSVLYYKSDKVLSDDEARAITDWIENSDFDIKAEDMDRFIIYVRIEDNAGNVGYIGSDGVTFDTSAPEIVGVENGNIYYVTKKIAIDDENLESVTLNGKPVDSVFIITGDINATYVIRAVDKAGNVTEYTVIMRPIASVTDVIEAITIDNIKNSDKDIVSAVERQILDIAEAFDEEESTQTEWDKLVEAAAKCKELQKRIADTEAEISRVTDGVNAYDIDKVTSDDKTDIEKLITDIDVLLGGDNLTDSERRALESLKEKAQALLDRIADAKSAAESNEIISVKDITKDNVKLGDKEKLEKAEKALESALQNFGGNYTEKEHKELESKLETVKNALAAIGNAEKAAEETGKLPSVDDVRLSDKSKVDRVKEIIDGLSENEKKCSVKTLSIRWMLCLRKLSSSLPNRAMTILPKQGTQTIWLCGLLCCSLAAAL